MRKGKHFPISPPARIAWSDDAVVVSHAERTPLPRVSFKFAIDEMFTGLLIVHHVPGRTEIETPTSDVLKSLLPRKQRTIGSWASSLRKFSLRVWMDNDQVSIKKLESMRPQLCHSCT